MQDGFSILSPAGYVMDVVIGAPVNGVGTYSGVVVSQLLPGGLVQVRGKGNHFLQGRLSGRQGTIQINCITGTGGAAQAIAFIAASSTLLLGVALDASNRPYALIVNNLGVAIAESEVFGPTLASGVPLTIQFAWDSNNVVHNGQHASFQFNDQIASWLAVVPTWDYFVPTSLYVGTSFGGAGLIPFTGVVGKVQVGDSVIFTPVVGAIEAEDVGINLLSIGDSILTSSAEAAWAAGTSPLGGAGLSADSDVVWAAKVDSLADSDLISGVVAIWDAEITATGDSSVAVDASWSFEVSPLGESDLTASAEALWEAETSPSADSSLTASAEALWEAETSSSADSSLIADGDIL